MSQKTKVWLSTLGLSSQLRTWIFRALVLILLGLPGSGKLIFDGLPFDSKVEFIFLVGVLGFGFAPKTKKSLRNWLNSLNRQWLIVVFGGLVLLVVIKILTFIYAPLPSGFEVCYRSVYMPLTVGKCEPSYDLPFISAGDQLPAISSVERKIDFGAVDDGENTATSNWRLPFLNDWGRFEPLWLTRLPFSADFAGTIDIKIDSWIPIVFTGELNVKVDDQVISAQNYEGSARVLPVAVSKGRHKVIINYRFSDDGLNTIPDVKPDYVGEYATLKVLQPVSDPNAAENEKLSEPISIYDNSSLASRAFFILVNSILILLFGHLILQLIRKYFVYFLVCSLIFGGVLLISILDSTIQALGLSRSILVIGLVFGLGLWLILKKCPQYVWFYGGAVGLIQVGSKFTSSEWWNVPKFRQRESDWFVHQGLSRMIFAQKSLEGGEPIFYFQPAMRYLILIGHLILGNNDVLMSILSVILFFSAFSVAMRRIVMRDRIFAFLPVLAMASLVILFSELNMASYVANLTTELPTWISLFIFLYVACTETHTTWRVVSLGLMAGLAMNFRPNQAPAWAYLVVVVALGIFYSQKINLQRNKLVWILASVAVLSGSLSLIHNLYYGRSLVVFSSSGVGSEQYPWKILLEMFYDAESRRIVLDKCRTLTLFSTQFLPKDKYWSYTNSFQLMHISWIISLILAFRTTKHYLFIVAYALVPFAFLVPMIMFDASSYYPRHMVIINLAFLFSAVLMIFEAQKISLSPAKKLK